MPQRLLLNYVMHTKKSDSDRQFTLTTTWDMCVRVKKNVEKWISEVEIPLITFLRLDQFEWSITQWESWIHWVFLDQNEQFTVTTTWHMYVWVKKNIEKYISEVEIPLITFLRLNQFECRWLKWKSLIYWVFLDQNEQFTLTTTWHYVCLSEEKSWGM